MSWGFWGDLQRQRDAAFDFLNRGTTKGNLLHIPGARAKGCIDSSNCASGWACVNGYCIEKDSGAGTQSYGDPTGCGNSTGGSTEDSGGGGGDCDASAADSLDPSPDDATGASNTFGSFGSGSTTYGSCTKSGCGGRSSGSGGGSGEADDCCGESRCCRFTAFTVRCYCGPCPPLPDCNKFCADYYAANGENAAGCTDKNGCDECSECVDGKCEPTNGPCWCQDDNSCGTCYTCQEDGGCILDCDTCKQCYTIYNYPCACGTTVTKKCCYDYCNNTKGFPECYAEAEEECEDICNPPGEPPTDPCAGICDTKTYCDELPPCPARTECTVLGVISTPGGECTIRQECDKTNIPDDCFPCDCNCDNDCPECYFCNSAGKCEPDPACEEFDAYDPRDPDKWWQVVVWDNELNKVHPIGLIGCGGCVQPGDKPIRVFSQQGWNSTPSNPTLQWYGQTVGSNGELFTFCVRPSIFDPPQNCIAFPKSRYEGRLLYGDLGDLQPA
jgi:hypothetical protein